MLQRSAAPVTRLFRTARGGRSSPSRAGIEEPALSRGLGTVGVLLLLAIPAAASADVSLGTTTQPAGSSPDPCFNSVIGQLTSDASTPYMVPAGGGEITAWQTNTTQATAGEPLTFIVLKPLAGLTYSVVATDAENLPNPLPANNVASFTLAKPIAVSGGETLGLYPASSSGPACYGSLGSTPQGDSLIALGNGAQPDQGQTLAEVTTGTPTSGGEFTLNLAATLDNEQDVGVTTSTPLTGASAGNPTLLASTVSNIGPVSAPITFTDIIPAGLQIDSTAAGSGSCSNSAQQVTCTITGLAPGQSAPVDIVVTPNTAGSYVNTVSVTPSSGITDPNSANNIASAVLAVAAPAAPPTAKCIVPALKGIPGAFARQRARTARLHRAERHQGAQPCGQG
jgi:hypothetical protein